MNFTTLDLPTKLKTVADASATGFSSLDADEMARVARETENSVKTEIARQMRIFLAEEKAYCDDVKARVTRITKIHDAAAKQLKALEKLKDKPKNATEIETKKRLIEQSLIAVTSECETLADMAAGLEAHQALRGEVVPGSLATVLGGTKTQSLDAQFKKLRQPAIAWIAKVKGPRDAARTMLKRLQVMQREAAVLANAVKDDANVAMAVDAELDALFAARGPLDMLSMGALQIEDRCNANSNDINRALKGRRDFASPREFEAWKKMMRDQVAIYKNKSDDVRNQYDVATAHLHAVSVLAKKTALAPEQKARVKQAETDLKAYAKQIKKNESAYTAFKKLVAKSIDKTKISK